MRQRLNILNFESFIIETCSMRGRATKPIKLSGIALLNARYKPCEWTSLTNFVFKVTRTQNKISVIEFSVNY